MLRQDGLFAEIQSSQKRFRLLHRLLDLNGTVDLVAKSPYLLALILKPFDEALVRQQLVLTLQHLAQVDQWPGH